MRSLRDILIQIPQDAEYHPEGNVWTHTRAVRRSLEEAIALLPEWDISGEDRKLLRLAAWCHDLGKAVATRRHQGRWIAPGHERANQLKSQLRQLSRRWRHLWNQSTQMHRKMFLYVCTRHMAVDDATGISERVMRACRSSDPVLSRRGRLAVILMVMDRLGTTRPQRLEDAMIVIGSMRLIDS
jgi:hypothetical protein